MPRVPRRRRVAEVRSWLRPRGARAHDVCNAKPSQKSSPTGRPAVVSDWASEEEQEVLCLEVRTHRLGAAMKQLKTRLQPMLLKWEWYKKPFVIKVNGARRRAHWAVVHEGESLTRF